MPLPQHLAHIRRDVGDLAAAGKEKAAFRARVLAVARGQSPARQRPAPPTAATPTPPPPELPKITGETIRRRRR